GGRNRGRAGTGVLRAWRSSGYRNGYRTGRLKTAEGVIEYAAPQISDRAVPFRSRLREIIRGRSEELEALAVEMYARGLSTRDIEALFADERGQSLLSRTAVSEITQRLWAEYEAFASRDLSEFEVIYLFVDGIASGCIWGNRARRCWPPGACWRTAIRCCCTWHRGARRTRRAAASSSRTCDGAACPIRCWSSPTARPA